MGRTVYGVDLEESPFGGLVEKLLTEEELEKLADGGAAPDGGSDDDDDDWSVSDDTYGPSGDADTETDGEAESETADVEGEDASEADSAGGSSWSPSSPPPSTAPGETGGYGSDTGYGGPGGFGAGAGLGADRYEDDDEGFLSKHKWLLLKVVVALAALAAVAVVVYRYKDRLVGLVPGSGGEESDDEFDLEVPDEAGTDDEDVSPARRRAKGGAEAPGTDAESEKAHGDREGVPPRPSDPDDVETPGRDLDLGALVGLGVLTLIAALVRKYDEERNRPHDPLVDGPLDDDVTDDDQ